MQYNKDTVQFYILVSSDYLQEKLKSYGDSKVKVYSDVSSIVNTILYGCLLLYGVFRGDNFTKLLYLILND